MRRALRQIMKNKTFYIFMILSIFMFPDAIFQQGDKARTAIVTTVGIDKVDSDYEVSVLTVIPKGASQLNANLELFSAKEKTVVKALDAIGDSLGKNIGLSHCDCIILSMDILEDDICNVLDYFVRNANMSNNASVIVARESSKEMLEASKSANNLYDLTLKDIVKYSDDDNYNTGMNIETFYKDYFSFDTVSIFPLLTIESDSNSSSGTGGGEDSSTSQSSTESSGSGGEDRGKSSGGNSKNVKNNGESVILKNGKYINTLTEDENYIYNLLSSHSKHESVTIDGVCDNIVTNAKETYRVVDKFNHKRTHVENGRPKVDFYLYLVLELEEVVAEEYSLKSIESLEQYITPNVKQKLLDTINTRFYSSVADMKKTNQDILKVGRDFYAYHTREWDRYIEGREDEYLEDIDFELHIDFAFKL